MLDGKTLSGSSRFRISSVGPRLLKSLNRSRVRTSSKAINRKYPQPSWKTAGGASTASWGSHTFHGLSQVAHVHLSMKMRESPASAHWSMDLPALRISFAICSCTFSYHVRCWIRLLFHITHSWIESMG